MLVDHIITKLQKNGWNGGGVGSVEDGSSGGGATDIRIGVDLNEVLVAGGGGAYDNEIHVGGGDGGGLTGQAGSKWKNLTGGPDTQYAGGEGETRTRT